MGVCFSLIFHIFLKENNAASHSEPSVEQVVQNNGSYQNSLPNNDYHQESNGYQHIEAVGLLITYHA